MICRHVLKGVVSALLVVFLAVPAAASAATPREGDRVRVTATNHAGQLGYVSKVNRSAVRPYTVVLDSGGTKAFKANQLEVVSSAPTPTPTPTPTPAPTPAPGQAGMVVDLSWGPLRGGR